MGIDGFLKNGILFVMHEKNKEELDSVPYAVGNITAFNLVANTKVRDSSGNIGRFAVPCLGLNSQKI